MNYFCRMFACCSLLLAANAFAAAAHAQRFPGREATSQEAFDATMAIAANLFVEADSPVSVAWPSQLAILVGAMPLAAQTQNPALRFAGCYDLRAAASEGAQALSRTDYLSASPRILLDTTTQTTGPYRGLRMTAAPRATPIPFRFTRWLVLGPDSVSMSFSSGFGGYDIVMRARGDSLIGSSRSFVDYFPSPPPLVYRITAVEVSCDAPLAPSQLPDSRIPQGVRIPGSDSVRIGDRVSASSRGGTGWWVQKQKGED